MAGTRDNVAPKLWGIFPLDAEGKKVCYNCGGPLPKGRPFNCSAKCSEEWRTKTSPAFMRAAVLARDHGVCAVCKVDTVAQHEEYRRLIRAGDSEAPVEFRKKCGIPAGRPTGDWWDADHITPVIEGGGECGIENFRTLCIPCHVKATRELRARMKERRRQEQAIMKDAERGLFAGL